MLYYTTVLKSCFIFIVYCVCCLLVWLMGQLWPLSVNKSTTTTTTTTSSLWDDSLMPATFRICEKVLETNLWLMPAVMMGSNRQSRTWNGNKTPKFNALRLTQHGWHLVNYILKYICFKEKYGKLIEVLWKFVARDRIPNNSPLVQMAKFFEDKSKYRANTPPPPPGHTHTHKPIKCIINLKLVRLFST